MSTQAIKTHAKEASHYITAFVILGLYEILVFNANVAALEDISWLKMATVSVLSMVGVWLSVYRWVIDPKSPSRIAYAVPVVYVFVVLSFTTMLSKIWVVAPWLMSLGR